MKWLQVMATSGRIGRVESAGECGRGTTPDNEAFKLAPCASAASDENASVSQSCCAQVKKLGQNPSCLCAVMLSNTAKMSGADPQIAVTIPKRCNIATRPLTLFLKRVEVAAENKDNWDMHCCW
ncbi:protease inhibitor/seed storage/ltp family [Trifolium pratense]|uniref:Protease inhibitor/seed storage/ltp family n=1 Tax=Trifolium pratense TaxID=57577 RepID=A0A2K3NTZ8_TRIPR|nr:protease inhibitor/seed storage/ltp family [Trifolium pratense]